MKTTLPPSFIDEEDKISWVENILSDFREGTASPEEVEELRALLLDDPHARRIYLESNRLTTLLESALHSSIPQATKKPHTISYWMTGIAAALLVGIGIWLFSNRAQDSETQADQNQWLAILSSSHEAKWEDSSAIQGQFNQGRIKLVAGIAELEFQNGATFVIEGPCELEIIDHDSIELVSGKLWGHCPPGAKGFEVLAPGGNRIIDLGTEFGIGTDASGAVDVHVFDGEVELFQDGQEKRALEAGAGLQLAPGEDPFAINANFNRFTDVTKLQRERWRDHQEAILARDDLLLYYDFATPPFRKSPLMNQAASLGEGKISGTVPVRGRMSNKSALLFEKPNDAVAIDLESLPLGDGFTMAMWIKPTDFSRSHMALLNSDGFDAGKIHFQIHDDGRLMTGISERARYASPRNSIKTDVWQLVAVRWDLENNEAQLFVNGQALRGSKTNFSKTTSDSVVNFGKCHIGTWAKPTYGHNRSFVGRIDEVMLFSSQLSESEMAQLFEQSRP